MCGVRNVQKRSSLPIWNRFFRGSRRHSSGDSASTRKQCSSCCVQTLVICLPKSTASRSVRRALIVPPLVPRKPSPFFPFLWLLQVVSYEGLDENDTYTTLLKAILAEKGVDAATGFVRRHKHDMEAQEMIKVRSQQSQVGVIAWLFFFFFSPPPWSAF